MIDILNDDRYKSLSFDDQQKVANAYFDDHIATDDRFSALEEPQQVDIKTRFFAENTRSFDKIMDEPFAPSNLMENIFGAGEQATFGNQMTGEVDTIFPDMQDGSTRELQQNIQLADNKRTAQQGINEFYSERIVDADKTLNLDSKWYSKQNVENRLEQALEHFNKNIVDEEFLSLPDENKASVLNNYFDQVVKPTQDEMQYQHNFMNAILNFADKSLHTVTGDDKWQSLSTAREWQNSKDETFLGQVGWMGGSVAPYLAGGVVAGTIPNVGKALLADSVMQGSLSVLEHGGKDTAMDNIALDLAIDTGINLLSFGVVRKLATNKLEKGELNDATQTLYGKNHDQLDEGESIHFEALKEKAKTKVVESVEKDTIEAKKQYDDDLESLIQDDLEPEPKVVGEIGGVKIVETPPLNKNTDEAINTVESSKEQSVDYDPVAEVRETLYKNNSEELQKELKADQTVLERRKARLKKGGLNNRQTANLKESIKNSEGIVKDTEQKIVDLNTKYGKETPKTGNSKVAMLGGNSELGGALGGGAVNEASMIYEEQVEGREISDAEKWTRRAGSVIGGKQLAKTQGGDVGTKMFVGAKPDEVIDTKKTVDDMVTDIPTVSLKDLEGESIIPIIADRTRAGGHYTGVDSAKTDPVEMMGGGLYPALKSSKDGGVVWASRNNGEITGWRKKAKASGKDYIYGIVTQMKHDAHKSNSSVGEAVLNTFEAYEKNGRLPVETQDAITEAIIGKAKSLLKGKSQAKKKVGKAFAQMPHFRKTKEVIKYIDSLTFEARAELSKLLQTSSIQGLEGVPSVNKILRETTEPMFGSQKMGHGQVIVKLYPNQPVKLGEGGTKIHPSYTLGIKGELVGKLGRPLQHDQIFPDYINAKKKAGAKDAQAWRAFTLSKPAQVLRKDIVDTVVDSEFKYIKSPRQAILIDNASKGRWKTSDRKKGDGGVSSTEFVKALGDSMAVSTLSKPDASGIDKVSKAGIKRTLLQREKMQLDKDIKSGNTKVYQLEDGDVYFTTSKNADYNAWFKDEGFHSDELTGKEISLGSVVNNEQFSPKVGSMVVAKAIEEGVEVLDAFAVKTKSGKEVLPSFYEKFGFEEIGRIGYNKEYSNPQLDADRMHYWKSQGWDEKSGMPDIVIMKWRGTDAERKGYTDRLLGRGDSVSENGSGQLERSGIRRSNTHGGDGKEADTVGKSRVNDRVGEESRSRRTGDVRSVYDEISSLGDKERKSLGLSSNSHTVNSSSTAGSALLGGAIGGIDTDENGNMSFNMQNALIGALAGTALGFGGKKGYEAFIKKADVPAGQLPPETAFQRTQRMFQDKFNRVSQLIEIKAGKEGVSDTLNPYQAEELYHGRAEARMNDFTRKITKPFLAKLSKSNYNMDDLDEYLVARHAPERNAKMLEVSGMKNGSGMSNDEASDIIARLDSPEMQELADYVYKMNKTRLELLRREGLESEEYIDMIKGGYEYYVPLKRDMSDTFGMKGQSTGRGFDVKGKEFKKAKGSDRDVVSPVAHSIIGFQESLVRSEKNKVGKAFLKFTEEFPDESLYQVQGLQYTPRYDKNGDIVQLDPAYQLADNVMHVKVNGKIKQITITDEALASAFKNLNPTKMNGFLKVAHKMVRYLASVSTQYNPEFVLSNFSRDIQTALLNLPKELQPNRASMVKDVPFAIKGIFAQERGWDSGEWGALFKEMKSEGGTTGWMEQYGAEDMVKNLMDEIDMAQGKKITKKAFRSTLDLVDHANNAVENGVRLIAYKQARKAGLTKKRSASIAKNLTVNFNRKGEAGTFMNTMYMFANASIQGTTRMAKALATSRKAQAGAVGIVGIGAGLDMYNNSVAPDDYRLLPDYIKDTNLVVMKGDESGDYYKIPLPYGYNIFKVLGDMSAEKYRGEESHNLTSRVLGALVSAFSPIGADANMVHTITPTLGKLPYELANNENFFGGSIRPDDSQFGSNDKAKSQQHFKSVNPLLRDASQKLNEWTGGNAVTSGLIDVSPENIEHTIEFVGGGLGKLVSNVTHWTSDAITGKETSKNKIPFRRKFQGELYDKAEKMSIYDQVDRSSREEFKDFEVKNFEHDLRKALKEEQIDDKRYLKSRQEFYKRQAKVKWAKENDIQGKPTLKQEIELDKYLYKNVYMNPKMKYGKATKTKKKRDLVKKIRRSRQN